GAEGEALLQPEVDRAVGETPGLLRPDGILEGMRAQARREIEALREVEHVGRSAAAERESGAEAQLPGQREDGVGDDAVALRAGHLVARIGGRARIVEAEQVVAILLG